MVSPGIVFYTQNYGLLCVLIQDSGNSLNIIFVRNVMIRCLLRFTIYVKIQGAVCALLTAVLVVIIIVLNADIFREL